MGVIVSMFIIISNSIGITRFQGLANCVLADLLPYHQCWRARALSKPGWCPLCPQVPLSLRSLSAGLLDCVAPSVYYVAILVPKVLNVQYDYPTIAIRLPYDLGYNADMTINKPLPVQDDTNSDTSTIIRGPGGRFLPGTRSPKPITHENARELNAKAQEKRRQVVRDALAAGVQRRDLVRDHGEFAWLAEGAQALQQIMLTPESGKAAIMAFESLQKAAGVADTKHEQAADAVIEHRHTLSDDVLGLLSGLAGADAFDNSNYQNHSNVVDGQAVDAGQADTAGE